MDTEALEAAGRGDKKLKRSKTTILVKIFQRIQAVEPVRCLCAMVIEPICPPPQKSSLIEFMDKRNASRAMNGLAYKRYKRVPLFLEWAQINLSEGTKAQRMLGRIKEESQLERKMILRTAMRT